jgi:dimethylhistidine N-methyltransferase
LTARLRFKATNLPEPKLMSIKAYARKCPIASSIPEDVLAGLTAVRKTLPSKYLYDAEGSRLFEAICELPEYYVTRTETALLRVVAKEIAAAIPQDSTLVEFGSGGSTKTRLLLDAGPQIRRYVPIDICRDAVEHAARTLRELYPGLAICPIVDDFTQPLRLPAAVALSPVVGFFPGSTIGNFAPGEAIALLHNARATLGPDSLFVVGADLAKSPEVVIPAYADSQGVTAAFNKNLLTRLNREFGADFDLEAFEHRAVWNALAGRIEMHLVSRRQQRVGIGGWVLEFRQGETIHTENSYKYDSARFAELAERAGWRVAASHLGPSPAFGIFMLAS